MGRFLAFLVIIVLIVACVGFARGWFFVTSHTDPIDDKVNVGLTVDKGAIRQDSADVKERAKELGSEAKKDAQNVSERFEKRGAALHANVNTLKMQPNTKSDVTVTRDIKDLKAEQVGLKPSVGSNLLASGGMFGDGAKETTITIEAPADAHDGSIALSSSGGTETITVTVSPASTPALVPINAKE